MVDAERIEKRVSAVEHGFKEMREEATKIAAESTVPDSVRIAKALYSSKKYQVRMVAVFLLGFVAARSAQAFRMLREAVSADDSWQVQEILAMAFNQYCEDSGYERSLPTIKDWLADKNPNARRAVTEGLRVWNRREYFKQHPELAVKLLAKLRDDDSERVRRSVGNALRDISRKEEAIVRKELATWDTSKESVAFTYALASKFL